MNKDTINKLLNKKNGLTGEELGKLLIYNGAVEWKTAHETGKAKPIFTEAEFNTLRTKSLTDSQRIEIFNLYVNLFNAIKFFFNTCTGITNKVQFYLMCKNNYLSELKSLAKEIREEAKHPKIFTKKEYEAKYGELYNECRSWKYSYIDLILSFIGHYTTKAEENPKYCKAVTSILKKYEDTPLKGKLKEIALNMFNWNSYKIDEFTTLSTCKDLIDECKKRNLTLTKYNIEDLGEASKKFIEQKLNDELLHQILTQEEIDKFITIEKETCPNPTKYDFITCTGFYDELETQDIYTTLDEEFSELLEFVITEIRKTKGLEVFKNIKPKAFNEELITLEELITNKILDYEEIKDGFIEDELELRNGYAILSEQSEKENKKLIDEKGYYKNPAGQKILKNLADTIAEYWPATENANSTIAAYLPIVYAYNRYIELISEIYDIECVKVFLIDMKLIEHLIENTNEDIYRFINYACSPILMPPHPDNIEAHELIQRVMTTTDPYIKLDKLKAKTDKDKEAKEYISNLKNYNTISPSFKPIYILGGIED